MIQYKDCLWLQFTDNEQLVLDVQHLLSLYWNSGQEHVPEHIRMTVIAFLIVNSEGGEISEIVIYPNFHDFIAANTENLYLKEKLHIKPYNKDIYDHIQCSAELLWQTVQSGELEVVADITASWKEQAHFKCFDNSLRKGRFRGFGPLLSIRPFISLHPIKSTHVLWPVPSGHPSGSAAA